MKCISFCALVVLLVASSFTPIEAQFDDVKGCLRSLEIPDIAGCVVGKFVELVDSIEINRTLPFSVGPGLYLTTFDDILDSMLIKNERALKQLPKEARGAGADSFLLKVYFNKLQRDAENIKQRHYNKDYSLPTLVDLFEDLLAVTKITDSVEHNAKQSDGIQSMLIESQRSILATHAEQFMIGRVLPVIEKLLGRKLLALENILQMSNEEELFMTTEEALQEFLRMAQCLRAREEEEFEDGLTWTRCLFTCRDLPLMSTCVINLMNSKPSCSRVPWIGDILIRLFTDYMQLGTCYFDIVSTPESLTEGGSTEVAQFRFFMPPSVHCFPPDLLNNGLRQQITNRVFKVKPPCNVTIHVTTTNYIYDLVPYVALLNVSMPRCRNRTSINQIAIGWHEHAVNSSGIIPLTLDNWNSTFRLPLTAVIDHKVRPAFRIPPALLPPNISLELNRQNISVQFTLKFHVDGTRMNTTKVPITVIDRDVQSPVTCHSVNDPHILTFDGTYYNNFYHGYFQFYKHHSLPYEVQVAYQACDLTTQQSCTCAVALRSGDDVFVVDKCRLHANYCSEHDESCRVMRVALYLNGELTPGTRFYQLHGGLGYKVVLPHGEILTVKSSGNMLNVWFTPSLYDWGLTKGLCGTYDGNPFNDYTLPDGTRCPTVGNPAQTCRSTFGKAWRLNYNETIFNGAFPMSVNESFMSSNFCRCSHMIRVGIRCVCGYDLLVDTCDFDLGYEFTEWNISALFHPSKKSVEQGNTDIDYRDFNIAYEPPALGNTWKNWTRAEATIYCNETVRYANELTRQFADRPSPPPLLPNIQTFRLPDDFEQMCTEDIQIIGYPIDDWRYSAVEAAKAWSRDRIDRTTFYLQAVVDQFENATCINECYGHGTCFRGTCHCDAPYDGPDCRDWRSSPVVVMDTSTFCDVRYQNCSFATVYGHRFTDDITCSIGSYEALEGVKVPSFTKEVGVLYISPSQIACKTETYMTSYNVEVRHGSTGLREFLFIAYDSACYVCDSNTYCKLKKDGSYCYAGGVCYANMEHSSVDECLLCDTSVSTETLTDSQDPVCVERRREEKKKRDDKKKEDDIRMIVSVSLSVAIVIITIIAFIVHTRSEKKKNQKEQSDTDKNTSSFSGSDVNDTGKENAEDLEPRTYTVPSIEITSPDDINEENGDPAVANAKLWDNRSMTSDLLRSRLNSITSVKSAGLGGVGPLHMSGQIGNDEKENAGMSAAQADSVKF